MKTATIEVVKRKRWYVRIRATNGKLWNCAESYASKSNAVRAAKSFALINEFIIKVV